jgi:hypothetical protein
MDRGSGTRDEDVVNARHKVRRSMEREKERRRT